MRKLPSLCYNNVSFYSRYIYIKIGYAKILIDGIMKYARQHFNGFKKLIRTTSCEYNKDLYIKYGAKLQAITKNLALQNLEIDKYYFYSYV